MSIPALNISYTYSSQKGFKIQGLEGDQAVVPNNSTIESIYNKYVSLFADRKIYPNALDSVLSQLKTLFEQDSAITIENIDDLLEKSQKINGESIESICREGYMALRYYLQTIIDKAKTLQTYIQQAQAALSDLASLSGPAEQINDKAHELITTLQICDNFSHEILQDFERYYQFDNDTKLWNEKFKRSVSIDESSLKNFSLNNAGALKRLRELQIPYHDSNAAPADQPENQYYTSAIQTFNSLTLMDRLRYIWFYYKVIILFIKGKFQDKKEENKYYTVFPDDVEVGFPCIPNEVAKEGVDQKSRGGMELFYVGYLIDRDGPINAISSFLEVKTQALRANLQLSSTQISSLNIYLEFVNKGLELLNSRKSGRIADGVATTVIGILGSSMYNTFKDDAGVECLVIPKLPEISDSNPSQFYLIKADDSGKEYFISGNTGSGPYWHINTNSPGSLAPQSQNGIQATVVTKGATNASYYYCSNHNAASDHISGTFKLPTKLNVQAISPLSIKGFIGEGSSWTGNPSTDVISSWTDAFTNKTKYINTAIDTINTDVQVDRNKVDSLDSMCSTFRSRAHDTYSNVASNIR